MRAAVTLLLAEHEELPQRGQHAIARAEIDVAFAEHVLEPLVLVGSDVAEPRVQP